MAGAADQPFDMNFSGAAPSAAAPVPAQSSGAADQPFDMNFSGGAASAPQAPAPTPAPSSTTFNANSYYAALANDYIRRTDASSATQTQARVDQVIPSADPRTAKVQPMQPNGRPRTALDDATGFLGGSWNKFASDVVAPYNSAKAAFGTDFAKANDLSASVTQQQAAQLAAVKDIAEGVVSPVTGLWNGFVTQPLASALDQLPAPYKAPTLVNGKVRADRMTPAEQHAANEQLINTAPMALGPEGAEVGSVAKLADAKNAANIASVTSKVPAEVAVTPSGKLTDEGLEYARNANVQPKDLEAAYRNQRASQQFAQAVAPKPPAPAAPALEPAAAQPEPVPAPIATANDASPAARPSPAAPAPANDASAAARPTYAAPEAANTSYAQPRISPDQPAPANDEVRSVRAAPPSAPTPEPAPAPVQAPAPEAAATESAAAEAPQPAPAPQAVWHGPEGEHPVEVTGEPQAGPGGRMYAPVRSMLHGGDGWVPTEELAPAADAEGAAVANSAPSANELRIGPDGRTIFGERPEDVPTTPGERQAEGDSLNIRQTAGNITRDFATQDAEERLAAGSAPESEGMRQFRAQQQSDILNASNDLRSAIADPTMTSEERGVAVQTALRNLEAQGLKGTSAAYDELRKAADALGEHGSEVLNLDTSDLKQNVKNLLMDESIKGEARNALRQLAAQYKLIGGPVRELEDGSAAVNVLDMEGKPGPAVYLRRKPEPLTIQNAEEFRQGLNRIYGEYETRGLGGLASDVDRARDAALTRLATGPGDLAEKATKARALYRQHMETFHAKDLIQEIVGWKVPGVTAKLTPEAVVDKLARAPASVLKKVKGTMMKTPEGKEAFQQVKSEVLNVLFKKAQLPNSNGGQGAFSGANLNREFLAMGPDRLRIILSESEFNQLNKFRRIVSNVTQKGDYIQNSSNSANVLGRTMSQFVEKYGTTVVGKAVRDIPFIGGTFEAASAYTHLAAENAANQATLQGAINPPRYPR